MIDGNEFIGVFGHEQYGGVFRYEAYMEYLRAKEERRRHWMKDT